jgi:hypothetical protein
MILWFNKLNTIPNKKQTVKKHNLCLLSVICLRDCYENRYKTFYLGYKNVAFSINIVFEKRVSTYLKNF